MTKILVTGSLAIDQILSSPQNFKEMIDMRQSSLSVSLFAPTIEIRHGGCAGNIAYALAQLGIAHDVKSVIGNNASDYFEKLKDAGVNTEHIQEDPFNPTATCIIFSDAVNNQINAFNPGAMATQYRDKSISPDTEVIIIAPNDFGEMLEWSQLASSQGVKFRVFDPGQAIHAMPKEVLIDCMVRATHIVVNESELAKLDSIALTKFCNGNGILIITAGEHGCYIRGATGTTHVPPVRVDNVVDTTGAGDSFRSGLLWGIINNKIEEGCELGAKVASYKIQSFGGQSYTLPAELRV